MGLINIVSRYKKAYRNWISVLYNMYKTRNLSNKWNFKIKVILRSNGKIREVNRELVTLYSILLKYPNIKDIDIENNEITFIFKERRLKFIEPEKGDLVTVFANEEYKFLNKSKR